MKIKLYNLLPEKVQPLAKRIYFRTFLYLPVLTEDQKKWRDARKLCSKKSPTIVDGGAHEGETIEDLKTWFSSPKIYAFEPNPEKFKILKEKYEDDPKVELFNYALGNKEETEQFNITESSYSSSLLSPTEDYKSLSNGKAEVQKTVEVKTKTLDQVIDDQIDILKLDLQGYEYFALQGAENILKDVEMVISETMFNINYEEQKTFDQLDKLLAHNNFKIQKIYRLKHWENGRVRHADTTYLKNKK